MEISDYLLKGLKAATDYLAPPNSEEKRAFDCHWMSLSWKPIEGEFVSGSEAVCKFDGDIHYYREKFTEGFSRDHPFLRNMPPRYFKGKDISSLKHSCGTQAGLMSLVTNAQGGKINSPTGRETFAYCPNSECDGDLAGRLYANGLMAMPSTA